MQRSGSAAPSLASSFSLSCGGAVCGAICAASLPWLRLSTEAHAERSSKINLSRFQAFDQWAKVGTPASCRGIRQAATGLSPRNEIGLLTLRAEPQVRPHTNKSCVPAGDEPLEKRQKANLPAPGDYSTLPREHISLSIRRGTSLVRRRQAHDTPLLPKPFSFLCLLPPTSFLSTSSFHLWPSTRVSAKSDLGNIFVETIH